MKICTLSHDIWHDAHCTKARALLKRGVHPDSFAALTRTAHVETLPAGGVFWQDGMDRPAFGVLCEGYLRVQRYSRDGRRQIVNLFVPGDLVGQDIVDGIDLSYEAATAVSIYQFDRRTYDDLRRHDPALRHAFYHGSEQQVERLRWLTWITGALHPDERLAAFLLNAVRFMPTVPLPGDGCQLALAISRRDIADLLATTPETVCRVLKSFEREGLIRMADATHVQLRDRPALVRRAALREDPVMGHVGDEPYCVPCQLGIEPSVRIYAPPHKAHPAHPAPPHKAHPAHPAPHPAPRKARPLSSPKVA